jgi:alpha-L-rhamnosidase
MHCTKSLRPLFLTLICLLGLLGSAGAVEATPAVADVANLHCEYRTDPLGLDVARPRLSWLNISTERGARQTAYQILVASSRELLARNQGDRWDSGKVTSDQQNQIEYNGQPLTSGGVCYWKVRTWDQSGKPGAWSQQAAWTMGLLTPSDWQAQWIGNDDAYQVSAEATAENKLFALRGLKWVQMPKKEGKNSVDTYLRREIELPADRILKRATWVLYAFNECRATVNGVVVGSAAHWEATSRLDVTKTIKPGRNSLGLAVSITDPYLPAAIGQLVLQFETGDPVLLPVDASWKTTQQAAPGWMSVGFDDSTWKSAELLDNMPWGGTPTKSDLPRMPVPYLRKEFALAGPVKRATAYVSALGVYELRLNGQPVGHDVLAPGWTNFNKRVHYQTYDVTRLLTKGNNVLGAILGDGWYASSLAHFDKRMMYNGRPRFIAQLELELADGTIQRVCSDSTWKTTFGPLRHADLLIGCEYDARLAMPGWDRSGFNDHGWTPVITGRFQERVRDVTQVLKGAIKDGGLSMKIDLASMGGDPALYRVKSLVVTYLQGGNKLTKVVAENDVLELTGPGLTIIEAYFGDIPADKPGPVLQASMVEPSRIIEELPARSISEPRPGCWTFDLGQNMVGWVRIKARGPAGRRLTLRHAEMLNPDGTLYTAALRSCPATDYYVMSGKGEETFEPFGTFHGFRYVEIRGLDTRPDLSAVTGLVVHTPMSRTGSFESSHPLLNQLYSNQVWGQKGNYLEVPTDCPQRDERMGWAGDTQFFAPTAAYNFNVANFFTRWLQNCRDDQSAEGSFPHVVPDIMGGGGSTAWSDAPILCTYNIYRNYGDTRLIAEQYAPMERYMKWLEGKTKDDISTVGGFGDWLNGGGGAKKEVIDTAYHAYLSQIMAEMAEAIGKTEDAARYTQRCSDIKKAFAREFIQPDGAIKDSSQTGYALAFTMDLLPPDMREKAADKFVQEIKRFKDHLATGFIGTPRLLPGLSLAGRDEQAYTLLLTDTYPSWLFPVKNGATTMWERWDGWTPEKGFGWIGMNSFNHYAFGAVGEYLYACVGGIQPASAGYKAIKIRPVLGAGLTWAKTALESPYGRIATAWNVDPTGLQLDVTIPPNTTATVYVPTTDAASVTESGKPVANAKGVTFLRQEAGAALYKVGAGSYGFHSAINPIQNPQ